MITIYSQTDFKLETGVYYSPTFKVDNDQLVTVESELSASGSVSLESSIDGENWYDIELSGFDCTPKGLQSYADAQKELCYRLKSTTSFVLTKILI